MVQFYEKGFAKMDADLINEENFKKCTEMKSLDLLMRILKKYTKNKKTIESVQVYLLPLLKKTLPFFKKLLRNYLLEFIKRNWKIEENRTFFDFMSNLLTYKESEFAEVLCLKPVRMLKNMFLFIKSLGYFINIPLLERSYKVLNEIMTQNLDFLEINEIMVNIENLFEKNENFDIFLVNLFTQKLFLKLTLIYKPFDYNNHPKIIILNHEDNSFKLISVFQSNIRFYLKIYQELIAECKLKGRNLNKFGKDILEILNSFYFKEIFMNIILNDLIKIKEEENLSLEFLGQLSTNIEEICESFFDISYFISNSDEFSYFSKALSRISNFEV